MPGVQKLFNGFLLGAKKSRVALQAPRALIRKTDVNKQAMANTIRGSEGLRKTKGNLGKKNDFFFGFCRFFFGLRRFF